MTPCNLTWNLIQLQPMIVKVFWINKSQLTFQPKLELNLKWIFTRGSKRSSYFQGLFLLSVSFSLISSSNLWSQGAALIPFLVRKLVLQLFLVHPAGSREVWIAQLSISALGYFCKLRQSSWPLPIPYCNAFMVSSAEGNHLQFI